MLVAGGYDQRLSRERGTLRSGERDLDGDRQPRHRALASHGDVAAQRQGARRRRSQRRRHSRERGTLRSGERDLDGHRQPRHRTRLLTRRRCCPTARCSSQAVMTRGFLASAELYDVGLGFSGAWQPKVRRLKLTDGKRLLLGARFSKASRKLRRQHPGFIEQLPDRAVAQHRQQPGCLCSRSIRPKAGRTQAHFSAGETLSSRPGTGDHLYQRHPEHCKICGRREMRPVVPRRRRQRSHSRCNDLIFTSTNRSAKLSWKHCAKSPLRESRPQQFHALFGLHPGQPRGDRQLALSPRRPLCAARIGRRIAPVRCGSGVIEKISKCRSIDASNVRAAVGPGPTQNTSPNSSGSNPILATGPHWWQKTALAKTKVNPGWPSSPRPPN